MPASTPTAASVEEPAARDQAEADLLDAAIRNSTLSGAELDAEADAALWQYRDEQAGDGDPDDNFDPDDDESI